MGVIRPVRLPVAKADSARALALSVPDGRAFTLLMAAYLVVWAALLGLLWVSDSVALQLLLALLLGNQLHALTVLQHDCGHRSAYAGARANAWAGRLLSWFIFMPFTTFTELHRFHHGFLGDPELDPDEWFYEAGPVRLFLRECLFMPRFIVLSLTRRQIATSTRRIIWAELSFNLFSYAALAGVLLALGQGQLLLYGFVLPMLLLGLVFNPLSRGFEHFPLSTLAAGDPRRHALQHNTVTVTSRILGVLWANINFHVEHHMFPRVPFYRLPALHRLLQGHAYLRAQLPLGATSHGRAAGTLPVIQPHPEEGPAP